MSYPSPGPDDGSGLRPPQAFGGAADPGYFASLRTSTVLASLRLIMLTVTGSVAAIAVVAVAAVPVERDPAWLVWPYVVLLAEAVVALVVGARLPRPLPPDTREEEAAGASVRLFRSAVFVRFALAEAIVLTGLVVSFAASSLLPVAAGVVVGVPALVYLAVPTRGMVERARRRLESRGVQSDLWTGLLTPASTSASGD